MRLFASRGDHEVPFHNAEVARDQMNALGAPVELVPTSETLDHEAAAMASMEQAAIWLDSFRAKN
jgi:hypothetical protein